MLSIYETIKMPPLEFQIYTWMSYRILHLCEVVKDIAFLKRHHEGPFIQAALLIVETIIETVRCIQQEAKQTEESDLLELTGFRRDAKINCHKPIISLSRRSWDLFLMSEVSHCIRFIFSRYDTENQTETH